MGEGHPGVPPRRTSFPPPPHHHLHPLPGESFRLTGFPEQFRATPHAKVRAPSGGGSSGEYCEPLMAAGAVGGASVCALWVFLTLRSRRRVPPPPSGPPLPSTAEIQDEPISLFSRRLLNQIWGDGSRPPPDHSWMFGRNRRSPRSLCLSVSLCPPPPLSLSPPPSCKSAYSCEKGVVTPHPKYVCVHVWLMEMHLFTRLFTDIWTNIALCLCSAPRTAAHQQHFCFVGVFLSFLD